jgi:hypothetical protein
VFPTAAGGEVQAGMGKGNLMIAAHACQSGAVAKAPRKHNRCSYWTGVLAAEMERDDELDMLETLKLTKETVRNLYFLEQEPDIIITPGRLKTVRLARCAPNKCENSHLNPFYNGSVFHIQRTLKQQPPSNAVNISAHQKKMQIGHYARCSNLLNLF